MIELIEGGLIKRQELRYGENPHQRAAWFGFRQAPLSIEILQGKEISHNNILDLDAAWRIVNTFEQTTAATCIVKHTCPCGVAVGNVLASAFSEARRVDEESAYGGIIGLNWPLDKATARLIARDFYECVICPDVEDEAKEILAAKKNLRLVVFRGELPRYEYRSALGGLLAQEVDRISEAEAPWPNEGFPRVVTERPPSKQEWVALRFAWRVCAHVKSNAVVYTDRTKSLGIGGGQPSRKESAELGHSRAQRRGFPLTGSVAASDAFFPFADGLKVVARFGATAVVQPGGSKSDQEVIEAADKLGLAMIFTGRRHFRH